MVLEPMEVGKRGDDEIALAYTQLLAPRLSIRLRFGQLDRRVNHVHVLTRGPQFDHELGGVQRVRDEARGPADCATNRARSYPRRGIDVLLIPDA